MSLGIRSSNGGIGGGTTAGEVLLAPTTVTRDESGRPTQVIWPYEKGKLKEIRIERTDGAITKIELRDELRKKAYTRLYDGNLDVPTSETEENYAEFEFTISV